MKITDGESKHALLKTERIDQILNRLEQQYGSQQFEQQVFDDLLQKFIVSTDQAFSLTENPEFRELIQYVHWTRSTLKETTVMRGLDELPTDLKDAGKKLEFPSRKVKGENY
ncbi:hypothetical protein BT69DRAFT_206926 [Atractiella rhizophila]|nr:hypothetical protein BT69DRAFT_206926 [Atractiella rhizophila]